MGNIKKNKDLDFVFDGIVTNALLFLKYSADEFGHYSKRSLIDFITALELFIKARLLKEHWTLLLNNLSRGNYANFVNGDLPTIDFKEAIDRLDNVLQEPLTKRERICFEKLRMHRHKLIHFYHKSLSDKKARLKALTEIAEGWFYLHRLLKNKWYEDFVQYQSKIDKITAKIDKNKKSWQGKYNGLKDNIDIEIKKGIVFKHCPICNYLAVKLEEYGEPIYESKCLICGQREIWLQVECDACGKMAYVSDSYSTCDCGEKEFTKEVLTDQLEVYRSPSELARSGSYGDIYCTECFSPESTVIELENGHYFCLECFVPFEEISECEWCNTRYAGDIGEDTYFKGCEMCEGHIGYHIGKDD